MGIKTNIHIGRLIRARLDETDMSCAEFARRLCIERSSVYGIFSKPSIDIERLKLIGQILDYDFITAYYFPNVRNRQHASIYLNESAISALQQGEEVQVTLCLSKNDDVASIR